MMMTPQQAAILNGKLVQLERIREVYWQNLDPTSPPMNSRPFIVTPNPFPVYPAPAAAAITVITYTVPIGQVAIINYLAVVNIGGGFVDGSGNIIWRVLRNGAALKGLNNLQSQVGTYAAPVPVAILGTEGDVLSVTAEVPAAAPPAAGTTAARFHGFTVPVVRR